MESIEFTDQSSTEEMVTKIPTLFKEIITKINLNKSYEQSASDSSDSSDSSNSSNYHKLYILKHVYSNIQNVFNLLNLLHNESDDVVFNESNKLKTDTDEYLQYLITKYFFRVKEQINDE